MLDALREAGLRVPEDVGVVGVDNWAVMAETARPPLTTVDLNLGELGRMAATELHRAIGATPLESGVRLLPCRLVARQSTESPVLARPNRSAAVLQRHSFGAGG